MKHFLLLSLISLSSLSTRCMEVVPSSCKDDVRLLTNRSSMFVEDENAAYRIEKNNMNPLLRDVLRHKALEKFKDAGYIRINKNSEGKYELVAKVRGEGGTGPITAFIVGMGVRVGCYTGYLLGVTTPVVVGTAIAGPAGAGAGVAAAGLVVTHIGAGAGVIAGTEALAMKATLATLLLPIPLP